MLSLSNIFQYSTLGSRIQTIIPFKKCPNLNLKLLWKGQHHFENQNKTVAGSYHIDISQCLTAELKRKMQSTEIDEMLS